MSTTGASHLGDTVERSRRRRSAHVGGWGIEREERGSRLQTTHTRYTMQLKALMQDKKAVSPVIGVILMVAITVILAAVIGTFVLGLGDQVGDSAPNAQFDAEVIDDDIGDTEAFMEFTHTGGDQVENSSLDVGLSGNSGGADIHNFTVSSDTLTAGDTITVNATGSSETIDQGAKVSLYWESGDRSAALRTFEVPTEISVS